MTSTVFQCIEQPGVFRICLDVEQTPVDTTHFREKLRHLQRLDYELVLKQLPDGEMYKLVGIGILHLLERPV